MDVLLKHDVDVNMPDPSGVPPLVIAMMNSNWDIARKLIEAGADVNQWDMYGQSPLAVAIDNMKSANDRNPLDVDHPNTTTGKEVVEMLIARGANPNQQVYFRPPGRGGGGRRHDAVHGGDQLGGHRPGARNCWPRAPIPG